MVLFWATLYNRVVFQLKIQPTTKDSNYRCISTRGGPLRRLFSVLIAKFQQNRTILGRAIAILTTEILGAVCYLGFDRDWVLTPFRGLRGPIVHQRTKFQQNLALPSCVINELTTFSAHFRGNFVAPTSRGRVDQTLPIWKRHNNNNNNNNPICKAPECQKTSVALSTYVLGISDVLLHLKAKDNRRRQKSKIQAIISYFLTPINLRQGKADNPSKLFSTKPLSSPEEKEQ